MQPRLGRQAEGACSTVADEEEPVTTAVPPKATEVIVELSLRRPGFDLHPGQLPDGRLTKDQVHVRLIPAQDAAALPTAARKLCNVVRFHDKLVVVRSEQQLGRSRLGIDSGC